MKKFTHYIQIITIAMAIFLFLGATQAFAQAGVSFKLITGNDAGDTSTTPLHHQKLIVDSNNCGSQGPQGAYVGFQITNDSGSELTGLEATLGGFDSGFALSGGQIATQPIGTLANGASSVVYWFISYPCTKNVTDGLTVTVNDPASSTRSFNVRTSSSLSNNSGGTVESYDFNPSSASGLGDTITMTVEYGWGNVKSGDEIYLQPSGDKAFNAACFQLSGSKITSSGVNGISVNTTDELWFSAAGGKDTSIPFIVEYYFVYRCTGPNTITARPYAAQEGNYTANYDSLGTGGDPVFDFSSASYSVDEGNTAGFTTNAQVTVNRTVSTSGSATVYIQLADGSAPAATGGTDYDNNIITVTFADGQASANADVLVAGDTDFESNEKVNLTLANPSVGTIGTTNPTAVLTINNDDPAFDFSSASYSEDEGNSGTTNVQVTVNRTVSTSGTATVYIYLSDGSATKDEDYDDTPITVQFNDSSPSETVNVPIIGDTDFEENETINLALGDPSVGTVGDTHPTAVLTINNDDTSSVPVFNFDSSSYSVTEDNTTKSVRVNRTGNTTGSNSVDIQFTGGTATGGVDYNNTTLTVTFNANETDKDAPIPIYEDTDDEGDETVTLTLTNQTEGNIGSLKSSTLTINDDDGTSGTGTISGTVFYDANGNKTQDAGEGGIAGVTVHLGGTPKTTGSGGTYSFTDLAAGSYTVVETDRSGYVSTTSNSVSVTLAAGETKTVNFGDRAFGTVSGTVFNDANGNSTNDGESGIGGVTVTLSGANGTQTTTTNASGAYSFTALIGSYTLQETDPSGYVSTTSNSVSVSLSPGSTQTANFGDQGRGEISGTVFKDINGNGSNDGESGISGVSLRLLNSGTAVASATTTADGSYSMTDVPAGTYTLEETDPAGHASTTPNSVSVTVTPGGKLTANFGDRGVGTVAGTVFRDSDGNGTMGAGESGIEGVSVALLNSSGSVIQSATTPADGSYQFTEIPEGDYKIRETDLAGYVSTTDNTVSVTVGPGTSQKVSFGDQGVGAVSGTVFRDKDGNGEKDTGENGIEGVTVELLKNDTVVETATTQTDGSYSFTNVKEGDYTIRETDLAGYKSSTNNTVSVTLEPGTKLTANFGDQGVGKVSGTVFSDLDGNGTMDEGEGGIAAVSVKLLNADGTAVASILTGTKGLYAFTNVPEGTYTAQETDLRGYVSTTENAVSVTIGPGDTLTVNFGDQGLGTVLGTVYRDSNNNQKMDDSETGLSGVKIQLVKEDIVVAGTITNKSGFYKFTNVPEADYIIRETDPSGFDSTTDNDVPISLKPGDEQLADFGDRGVGTVSGTVFRGTDIAESDSALQGIKIELLDSTGTVIAVTITDKNGFYKFTNVPEGNYTVREIDPDGYTSTTDSSAAVSVEAGDDLTADFGEWGFGTIFGIVFRDPDSSGTMDEGESGLEDVRIELLDASNTVIAATRSDEYGFYRFTSVPEGDYTVQEIDPEGFSSTTDNKIPVVVRPEEDVAADFGDQGVGTVSGTVFRDPDGSGDKADGEIGLENVKVELIDNSTGQVVATTKTDENGYYKFTYVPEGDYTVREIDPSGFSSATDNGVPVSVVPGDTVTSDFGDRGVGDISGTIFTDPDGNGHQDDSDSGLGDVRIELVDSSGTVIATTKTDDYGYYSFTDVPEGTYIIREVDPSGFVNSTTESTVPVTVRSGREVTVDFGNRDAETVSLELVNTGIALIAATGSADSGADKSVAPGDILNYHIAIPNTGDTPARTALSLPMPENTSFVAGSLSVRVVGSSEVSVVLPAPRYDSALNQIIWSGEIPAGETVEIVFDVVVDENMQPGDTISAPQWEIAMDSDGDGTYELRGEADPYDAAAPGAVGVEIPERYCPKGDISGDGFVDLRDAIMVLKVMSGIQTDEIYLCADVNKDGVIGIEDMIYVLRNTGTI
jgi:hypothetical protein